jgi:hypothetical protein
MSCTDDAGPWIAAFKVSFVDGSIDAILVPKDATGDVATGEDLSS